MLARITNPTQGVGVATLTLEQLNQSSLNLFDGDDLFIQFIDGQGDLPSDWKKQWESSYKQDASHIMGELLNLLK